MVNKENILKEIRARGRNQGLIAIQAQKEIILEAIDQGANLKTIHAVLEEKGLMPVKYSAFARLVKKHLKRPPIAQTSPKKIKSTPTQKKKNFSYNPDAENIDDLK